MAIPDDFRERVGAALRRMQDRHVDGKGLITQPRSDDNSCTLLFGSCQYAPGLLDGDLAYTSWRTLNQRLDSGLNPDLLLLLGDQVYVDATAGLFDPAMVDDRYVLPYWRWLSNDDVQRVLARVPAYMMLDDHEISNDWQPGPGDVAFQNGREAFTAFQFNRLRPSSDGFWGEIPEAPLPLFMMDTRTERQTRSSSTAGAAQIMSDRQFSAVTSWLSAQSADQPKIITSSTMLLPRHRAALDTAAGVVTLDTFEGYPGTLNALLRFVLEEQVEHVIFLSGDEHLPIHAEIVLQQGQRSVRCHSIHTAGLYTPYRFANTRPDDIVGEDSFRLISEQMTSQPETNEANVRAAADCTVKGTCFDSGAGFTVLKVTELNRPGREDRTRFRADATFQSSNESSDAHIQFVF